MSNKLYPFSTIRNQHNFFLIYNVCKNRMSDMEFHEVPFDDAEYARLDDMCERACEYMQLDLPVAWLPYQTWADAKALAEMAVSIRAETCIEKGRPDLVEYC